MKYKTNNEGIYDTTHFTLTEWTYYSPIFKVEGSDSLITIQANLSENGTIIIQSSIDETDWFDIANTTFNCSPKGLQSYIECQKDLSYRLKVNVEVISLNILI